MSLHTDTPDTSGPRSWPRRLTYVQLCTRQSSHSVHSHSRESRVSPLTRQCSDKQDFQDSSEMRNPSDYLPRPGTTQTTVRTATWLTITVGAGRRTTQLSSGPHIALKSNARVQVYYLCELVVNYCTRTRKRNGERRSQALLVVFPTERGTAALPTWPVRRP